MAATLEQSLASLPGANDVRLARAQFRRDVRARGRAGALTAADVIMQSPQWCARVWAWQIVHAVPKIGDETCCRIMRKAQVDPWRRVGRLTDRERRALADLLRAHAAKSKSLLPPSPPPRNRRCVECGLRLQRPSDDGLCGFCREELAEGEA